MSYQRNYRKRQYYRQRRTSGNSLPLNFFQGAFLIILGIIILDSLSSEKILGALWSLIVLVVILGAIVFVVKKFADKSIRKRLTQMSQSGNVSTLQVNEHNGSRVNEEELAELNSEKHGCKCYMDWLTDGEQEVAYILSEKLSYKDYFIFNNLTIPSEHNGSSQIDHLVISKFGVFVVESKDYSGWIFGSKDNENWTQVLAGGNSKIPFKNPIHQNWSHIMSLRALLPSIPENAFQNIVVFGNSAEFKTESIKNVVTLGDLVPCIQTCNEPIISEEQLVFALGKLSFACQTADISLEQHIDNIHNHHPTLNNDNG